MVLNATFNNISAILGQSDLLVEEPGVLGENLRPDLSVSHVTDKLYHIMLSQLETDSILRG